MHFQWLLLNLHDETSDRHLTYTERKQDVYVTTRTPYASYVYGNILILNYIKNV